MNKEKEKKCLISLPFSFLYFYKSFYSVFGAGFSW